jgi:hypothetical protein
MRADWVAVSACRSLDVPRRQNVEKNFQTLQGQTLQGEKESNLLLSVCKTLFESVVRKPFCTDFPPKHIFRGNPAGEFSSRSSITEPTEPESEFAEILDFEIQLDVTQHCSLFAHTLAGVLSPPSCFPELQKCSMFRSKPQSIQGRAISGIFAAQTLKTSTSRASAARTSSFCNLPL